MIVSMSLGHRSSCEVLGEESKDCGSLASCVAPQVAAPSMSFEDCKKRSPDFIRFHESPNKSVCLCLVFFWGVFFLGSFGSTRWSFPSSGCVESSQGREASISILMSAGVLNFSTM